jgi:hypothetical protein
MRGIVAFSDGASLKTQARTPAEWRRLALTAAMIGVAWILGHAARWFADGMAVNAQLYFHAFRMHNVLTPWRLAPLHFFSGAVLQNSALVSWAFASGYLSARVCGRRAIGTLGAFVAIALLGTAVTTTSVRIAQPRFFESAIAATAYPFAVKLLFIAVPAYLAARAVRRQTTSVPAIAIIAAVGIVLAGWNASDLGYALTYGCVWRGGSGTEYCTSLGSVSGFFSALLLAVSSASMAWDAWANRSRTR